MCVCTCVCECVCVNTCMHVCVCMYACVCAALLSLFEKLSQQGNLDSLKAITTKRLPPNLRSSLMAYTFAAALNRSPT